MRRFLQGILAIFRMDWDAFIAADMEDESRMMHEPMDGDWRQSGEGDWEEGDWGVGIRK